MKYKLLGSTGVKVSSLCFGTMSFGGDADKETSRAMFNLCRDRGINFFDTANIYSQGVSEEFLGEFIRGCRDELVISSKVCGKIGTDINAQGLSRRHIMQAVEGSLRRLGTDRIDLYFVHNVDFDTPIEETLRALDDLQRQGKIIYPAVSNWSAWQIAKALGISENKGLARFVCIQPMYNLVKRQVEVEILPLAASENLGVITYSPLGGGLLTGKYGIDNKAAGGRLVDNSMYRKRYGRDVYYQVAEKFNQYAYDQGIHPATLAVAWVMSHPHVTAPIIGARNVEQLERSLAAVEIEMTLEQRHEISRLSPTPPPATDRSENK